MKTKKDIDDMIALTKRKSTYPNGNHKNDPELDGRLAGLEWGRDRSFKEIKKEMKRLKSLCPGGMQKWGDKELQARIRALQWIIRPYKKERKKKKEYYDNIPCTGTVELREEYIRPRGDYLWNKEM